MQRHFEVERENFSNRTFKIKTLALFFIDDITSYRVDEDGKKPYLLTAFERLLEEQIINTIDSLTIFEDEYKEIMRKKASVKKQIIKKEEQKTDSKKEAKKKTKKQETKTAEEAE